MVRRYAHLSAEHLAPYADNLRLKDHNSWHKYGTLKEKGLTVKCRKPFVYLVAGAGFDKGKKGTEREDKVLFIDARHIYRQIDRAHRDWPEAQISFIANIVRLYRGEVIDLTLGDGEAESKLKEVFGDSPSYQNILGLCKVATLKEIEAQGWSLNPGRYVGVALGEEISDEDFKEKLETLNEELEVLNAEARKLEATIAQNVVELLEA